MHSLSEMRNHLIQKAEDDRDFRSRLIADPSAVVKEEFGIKVPKSFHLNVVEEDEHNAWLVLPLSPLLTDEQLASVQGGYSWGEVFD